MTDEELQAIKARADAATEGPWKWQGDEREGAEPELGQWDNTTWLFAAELVAPAISWKHDQRHWIIRGEWHNDSTAAVQAHAPDAEFIAHARNDVPALVAEVERLRAELALSASRST